MWLNKIDIIQIGNSKGIRIPKVILEQCHIKKAVDIAVENDKIIIMPHTAKPRKNWAQAFEKMAKNKDDKLLIEDSLDINIGEWQW